MRIEKGDGWTLTLADWRDCELPDVDSTIEDPPYSERTHGGQRHERATGYRRGDRRGNIGHRLSDTGDLGYESITAEQAAEIAVTASAATRGWICEMTSHDLVPAYEDALRTAGRYVFAPLPIVIPGMNVRLAGDGPSNWTIHLVVARTSARICWSAKPGAYRLEETMRERKTVKGAKSVPLMEAILRDYTARGDLVMDRFAGSGTTGVAAIRLGRRFVGWERKPEHFEIALKRLRAAHPQAEAFATDGIIGKPMQLPGTEETDAAE